MSNAPDGTFQATSGKLGQIIYENPDEGIAPQLRFFIEIAFAPFEWDGETLTPLFRADNIIVPVKSWRALTNTKHEFPWAPKPGSVEAAILLFGEHNPADVTALKFGPLTDGKLSAEFATEVDFEIEADRDDLEQIEFEFSLPLSIEPLRISTRLEKRCQGDEATIMSELASLIETDAYGDIEKVPGGFVLPPATAS